ncbi:hypothetical protein QYF36_000565 [Acer negundo]|nr:hypothetical protein QYF36_000565 [Acer negundo]
MILMLAGKDFSGKIPKSITKIYRLLLLDLARNRFSGKPPNFDPEALLAFIDLSYNEFSGNLPRNLTNLSKPEQVDLHDNGITCDFPRFLSQISTLQVLNLRNNSLQGSMPDEIANLRNLGILNASCNNLTRKIPAKFGNLDLIVNWKKSKLGLPSYKLGIYSLLDLSKKKLSGQIPTSLGSLKGLKQLNISYNNLTRNIPVSFGYLRNLESLDLSHNQLSGLIPPTLVKQIRLCGMQIRFPCPPPKPHEDEKEEAY